MKDRTLRCTRKIENSEAGIKEFLASAKSEMDCRIGNAIYCAEHMGIYATFLKEVLSRKGGRLCLESPLHMNRSLGIQRGKNDALDAIRIADYARKNADTLKFWTPARPCIEKLMTLMPIRKKLLTMSAMLQNTMTVEHYFLSEVSRKEIGQYTTGTFQAVRKDIELVEAEMAEIVDLDERLRYFMD